MCSEEISEEELQKWMYTEAEIKEQNEQYLAETAWIDELPPRPSFAHTFVDVSAAVVLDALKRVDLHQLHPVSGVMWSSPGNREALRLFPIENGTMVWHLTSALSIMKRLSALLNAEIHWIDVHEFMAIRGYACFQQGKTEVLIRDPVYGFETSSWNGIDMQGEGPRDFESLDAFLQEVAEYYIPKDRFWSFHRWDRMPDEPEMQFAEGEWQAIDRCFTVQLGGPEVAIEPTGNWTNQDFESDCKQILGVDP